MSDGGPPSNEIAALPIGVSPFCRRTSVLPFSAQNEKMDVSHSGDSGFQSKGYGASRNGRGVADILFL